MSRTVLLDSGPIGLITNPRASPSAEACGRSVVDAIAGGAVVLLPEIADYEVRRELIRARRVAGIGRLDAFIAQVEYLPIQTPAMRQAAMFWAEARREGRPTAPDPALDADVILAAQAATLDRADVIVATTNPRHLSRYVPAALWTDIVQASDVPRPYSPDADTLPGPLKRAGDVGPIRLRRETRSASIQSCNAIVWPPEIRARTARRRHRFRRRP